MKKSNFSEVNTFPSPAACKLRILTNNYTGSDLSRDKVQRLNLLPYAGEVKNRALF